MLVRTSGWQGLLAKRRLHPWVMGILVLPTPLFEGMETSFQLPTVSKHLTVQCKEIVVLWAVLQPVLNKVNRRTWRLLSI